jgi:WD40 repeat protein
VSASAAVTDVAYTPDDAGLYVALDDGRFVKLDAATGEELLAYTGQTRRLISLAASPDGKFVAGGTADGQILIWDSEDGTQIARYHQLPTGEPLQRVLALSYSPDSSALMFGTLDGVLALWEIATNQAAILEKADRGIWNVDFSPNGQFAVSGDAVGALTLWDVQEGGALRRFREHRAAIMQVAFSPDGQHVATASRDHTALLWDMPSLETLLAWTRENRYIETLTCEQQAQYRITSTDCQEAMLTAPMNDTAKIAVLLNQ